MTTELAPTASGSNALSVNLAISDADSLNKVAASVAQSGILGQITQSQAAVSLVAMREEGLSIVGFKAKHQWVGTELSTKPNWMLGEFKRRGGKVHIAEATREACEIRFTHWDGEELTVRITMDDMKETTVPFSKDGKTLKANWRNFPDDMLFARVCGKGLRRICPELFCGMYTDGEAADFDRAPIAATPAPKAVEVPKAESVSPLADTDPNICPVKGDLYGRAWADIPTDRLNKALKVPPEKCPALTDAHREAIVAELGRREEAAQNEAASEADGESEN